MSQKKAPEDEAPTIAPQKDGPLKVTGLERFTNSRGEAIPVKKSVWLCRCGHSRKKPFCDGTHSRTGFNDGRDPDRVPDKLEAYQGEGIRILDNRGVCSHAGRCTDGLPRVWRSGVEPWIDPGGAPPGETIRVIRRCPSGALSYDEGKGVQTSYHDEAGIRISRNGPYQVRGGVRLEGAAFGAGASREHYTLCRCGHSRNKPFCDGSHWYAGFKDDEALTISGANRTAGEPAEDWIALGKAGDFEGGTVHPVTAGEKVLALVRAGEGWKALEGRCPHQGGPLTEGILCDGALRCPWHGYDFAVETGKGVGNDMEVATYEVREREDLLEVKAPAPARSAWTTSHVIVETLVEWGLDTVFGMVGHSNLGLAEAIRVQEERGKLRYIGVRHEGAAAFACSGYAKVSGRPAACLSIAGPGATNLLTGLWDARMDRAPVLALTGQVNTQVMGPGSFQEIDLASAFEPVARFSQTVLPGSDHAGLASLAMKSAIVERDVSHLIFPDEVQVLDAGREGPGRPEGRVGRAEIAPPAEALDLALHRLGRAKRPVIIAGYGARGAMDRILELAEAMKAPVLTTFKGKGLVADDHPLAAGVLGRSGTPVASWFMNQADLLLVFGASFAQHTGIDAGKPIIQVDFDRMALGKFHPSDEPIWGEIGVTARLMREKLPAQTGHVDQRPELAERWAAWRAEKKIRAGRTGGSGLNSAMIFEELSRAVPADAILSVDVGNNTYSFGRYFESRGQPVIMSGYLGSIGFALPAAMGAWAAGKGRKVVSVSGDGGFGQYMGELMTVAKHRMNITHVLLNNGELGKISKEQRDGEWKVWQTDLLNVSFAAYAELCGLSAVKVEKPADLPAALGEAIGAEGPALVEIISDPLLT